MGILTGRTAVITGAGSGLGRATALAFAKEGAAVVLCGRRKAKLEETGLQIEQLGGKHLAVQTDAAVEADANRAVREAIAAFGKIDILVNNAATFKAGLLIETSLEEWNEQLHNNLTSVFLMTRAALPHMRKNEYGRIINITSALAVNGAGGYAAYSASKAGLESLTRTVAEEERTHNILANMFNPGMIKTEMHATGKDPSSAAPDLLRLASLPNRGASGKLFVAGDENSVAGNQA